MIIAVIAALADAWNGASAEQEARCPHCRRLLFKGTLAGEIRCPRCLALVKFGARVP